MTECSHDCANCASNCADRAQPQDLKAKLNDASKVRRVIGVVSGKGGVGKSLVTALLAAHAQKSGRASAVLDADVTGPSIPRVFGLKADAIGTPEGILPGVSRNGTQIMSVNMMLENETDPVIWRGPVIAGVVKQFWTDVYWKDVDTMFIDMPPGTGDVPLTVFQSIPVDGIVVVTSPQELVGMIVAKAVKMANMLEIPILGIVENMSYFECPKCGERHQIFGESHVDELAASYGIGAVAKIPMDPSIAHSCDAGEVESIDSSWLAPVIEAVLKD